MASPYTSSCWKIQNNQTRPKNMWHRKLRAVESLIVPRLFLLRGPSFHSPQSSMRKQNVMAGDMPFLPEEIIRNILIRLPVKSLIRFQCVCKEWRNLIKTSSFISEHLHHPSRQNPSLLFQGWRSLWLLDCKMQLRRFDNAPLIDSSNTFRIVGSINGLVCVDVDPYSVFSRTLFLWNPATREVRQLPPNREVLPFPLERPFDVGFGFSPIVNDYKIVVIYFNVPLEVLYVLVYSLSSESWKEVEFGIENVGLFSGSVAVNGAMFWFGLGWEDGSTAAGYDAIISFDLANEVFTLIKAPDWSIPRSRFAVYENKLAVLCFVELWVMGDSTGASWAKICSSSLFPCSVRPVTIWMNQIICHGAITSIKGRRWKYEKPKVALLNISTDELKTFDISKCGGGDSEGYHYVESLVPII